MITADDLETLRKAALNVSASPSVPVGRIDSGVEKWVSKRETPDGRMGMIAQFWAGLEEGKPQRSAFEKLEKELSYRIRQNVMVKPFTN